MIEIKAKAVEENEREGVDIKMRMVGRGDHIEAEALAIISALMRDLKSGDKGVHEHCLKTIAEHPEILLGEDQDLEEMTDRMAMSLGKMTDKCVIN